MTNSMRCCNGRSPCSAKTPQMRMTEYYCHDVGDVPVRDALVPVLVESLKTEFRRLLRPH